MNKEKWKAACKVLTDIELMKLDEALQVVYDQLNRIVIAAYVLGTTIDKNREEGEVLAFLHSAFIGEEDFKATEKAFPPISKLLMSAYEVGLYEQIPVTADVSC